MATGLLDPGDPGTEVAMSSPALTMAALFMVWHYHPLWILDGVHRRDMAVYWSFVYQPH